jgi:hypothetical protein
MKKLLVYILIMVLAVVFAGLYDMLHNQISYTVSPECFTKFKFEQFGLTNSHLPERLRASLVGLLAAGWMGIPIGWLVGAVGFIHEDHRQMLRVSLWSMLLVVGSTLLFGLGGLIYGFHQTAQIDPSAYDNWYIPDNVTLLRRLLCAGYMHNSSYLGGALAIFVALAFHIIVRVRSARRTPPWL